MWALEYEVDELQTKFAESIGTMDLDNLDVDFIEDMMLKAKPLQSVLNCIRNRQIVSDKDCAIKSGRCHPSHIPNIVVAGKAGGREEAVRGPDQGPGGDEGDPPGQASGSWEGEIWHWCQCKACYLVKGKKILEYRLNARLTRLKTTVSKFKCTF